MERICKNCKWACGTDDWYDDIYCCELDYETVHANNTCDQFDGYETRNFIKTKKKGRYQ